MAQVRIAGIQFLQRETKSQTYEHIRELVSGIPDGAADLIMLPEMWNGPYEAKRFPAFAEPEGGPGRLTLQPRRSRDQEDWRGAGGRK